MVLNYLMQGIRFFLNALVNYIFFLLMPACFTIFLSWFMGVINVELLFPADMLKSASVLFSTFVAGAIVGKKIAGEPGGMLSLFIAIFAFTSFAYLTYLESQGHEILTEHMPWLQLSVPEHLCLLLPAVGFMGVIFYKFVTFGND